MKNCQDTKKESDEDSDSIFNNPPSIDSIFPPNKYEPISLFPSDLYSPRTSPSPTLLWSPPVLTPNTLLVFLQNSDFDKSVTSPSSSSAIIQYSPPPPPPPTTSKGDHLLSQGQYTTISPSTSNFTFPDFGKETYFDSGLFPSSFFTEAFGKPCPTPIVQIKPLKIQKVQVPDTTTPKNIDEAATVSSTEPSTSKDTESDTTEGSIWSPSVEQEESEEEYIKVTRRKCRTKIGGQISTNKRKFAKRK